MREKTGWSNQHWVLLHIPLTSAQCSGLLDPFGLEDKELWGFTELRKYDYRRKPRKLPGVYSPNCLITASRVKSLNREKKIFCLNYTQSDPDRWLTKWEKHQLGSIGASFPISLLSLFLHLVEDRWILIPVVVTHVTVWDETSGENMRASEEKIQQQNIAADSNLFPDFPDFLPFKHLNKILLFYWCRIFSLWFISHSLVSSI